MTHSMFMENSWDVTPSRAWRSRLAWTRALRVLRVYAMLAGLLLVTAPLRAHAETRVVQLSSRILGESRTLHVSLPPNYRIARQRYPVVYLLDGQVRAFFDVTVAATGYDLLGDQHGFAMPPQIVIGIEQRDRGTDLSRNAVLFSRFLTDELIPFVERTFRTVPFRTLIGHSLGGRFALDALCRTPDTFASIVAISAAAPDSTLGDLKACLRRDFATASARARALVLCVGDQEPRLRGTTALLAAFMRDSAPARWRTLEVPGTGLGHTDTPLAAIPPALRFVYDKAVWEMPYAVADSMLRQEGDVAARLDRELIALRSRVGFRATASAKWLEAVTRSALARGELDAAVSAAQGMIESYPELLVGYTLLADTQVRRHDDAAARRSIQDALELLNRIESFDETQREAQRVSLRQSLAALAR
jgi:predicted alpha/beta superfamily hydrolase